MSIMKNCIQNLLENGNGLNLPAVLMGEQKPLKVQGNAVTIEFTRTTIKTFVNGNLESEMNYEIQSGSSIRTTEKTDLIVYENGTIHSVLIEGNSLVLFEECYDCFQHNYLKD